MKLGFLLNHPFLLMNAYLGPNSLIQSDFLTGPSGDFVALFLIGGRIHQYHGAFDGQSVNWSFDQVLPSAATGPASLIQSDFPSSPHGNFEAVVLEADGLWHWWHDNSNSASPWQRAGLVSPGATGPGSIIQSNFQNGNHGNFEVVVLQADGLWHWWHDNSNVTSPWQRAGLVSSAATGPGCIIQSNLGDAEHGNFEVVVLEGNELWHHWHDNSDVTSPWQRGQRISAHASGPGSIIQGSQGAANANLEVVVQEGSNLVHYWHDSSDPTSLWQRGQTVSVAATGRGCLALSKYGPGAGNFQVLVQELTQSLVHYWHDNIDPTYPWWRGPRILTETQINSPDLASTVKIAQLTGDYDRQWKVNTLSLTATRSGVNGTDLGSSFEHAGQTYFLFGDTHVDSKIRNDPDDNYDTIAYTSSPPDHLVLTCNPSYPKVDNIDQRTFCVPCDGVSLPPLPPGTGWIIQSNLGDNAHYRTFEVVALEGSNLVHWRHDNSHVTNPWRRAQVISTAATGPGCIIQSNLGTPGNFEVVVPEGDQLRHYWHDNSNMDSPWQAGQIIVNGVSGPGCIIQSNLGSPGNFEVVVPEGNELWHHWHDNSNIASGWLRAGLVASGVTGPGCIIQSTMGSPGNFEVVAPQGNEIWHHWHDNSNITSAWQVAGRVTSDASGPACIIQSNFGSPGNFEVVVQQGSGLWHHWHDNSNVTSAWQPGGKVASNITGPGCIIQSNFGSTAHGNFEVVVPVNSRLQHYFHDNSEPTLPWTPAQIITNPGMYVFFTTDPIRDPDGTDVSMGRTVLARSDDNGVSFGAPLFDLSRTNFINVSLQVVDSRSFPGLPQRYGQGLLIWATGPYRKSNVYLGFVPLASIEDRSAYVFYAGLSPATQLPIWVSDESQAASLFLSGCMGELCVRWNPFLSQFVMTYNSDNPWWILARQANLPWGPWTSAENILNGATSFGVGGFMHDPTSAVPDGLSDPGKESTPGAPYGPYLISNFTRQNNDRTTTMYFALSPNNPYNVMLMSATFRARDPATESGPPKPDPETGPLRPGTGPVAPKFPIPTPPANPFRPGTGPVGRKFPPPAP